MMTTRHPLATAWLDRVATLAADLPPGTRSELLVDLGDHLDEALVGVHDTAGVESVLARLGDPVDVVAAAREADGTPPPRPGPVSGRPVAPPVPAAAPAPPPGPDGLTAVEAIVLVLLVLLGLVGFVLVPMLGLLSRLVVLFLLWGGAVVVGVVVGRWTGGEVVGLALLPVGWSLPVASLIVPVRVQECVTDAAGVETCTGGGGSILAVGLVLVGLVLVGLWTRWLARAPRGRPLRR